MQGYKVVYEGGSGEIVEKKSRFIATVQPVEQEEEAVLFINGMKKKHWDASHNCSAFTIGRNHELTRCSDDGEPAQTAGRPMLDVLLGEEIRNVCVVVTRYFGGTLLGTGGLVRAYSAAVKEGLKESVTVKKQLGRKIKMVTDYNGIGKIQYVAGQMGILIMDTQYTDQVTITFAVPKNQADAFLTQVTEKTAGKAVWEEEGQLFYGMAGEQMVFFEG